MDQAPFGFDAGMGQRSEAFAFLRREGASLRPLGELHPIRGASMSQSGSGSLMRTLSFDLGEAEAAEVNTASDRIDVSMVFAGRQWPLGRYLFTDATRQDYFDDAADAPRSLLACSLADQMVIVDTQLESAFTCVLEPARSAMERLVGPLPIETRIEDSDQLISNSWTAGTSRKRVLEALAELGGYLPPWFDNDGVLRAVQIFDPDAGVADFDWDTEAIVIADSVTRSSSVETAPNRIVVVSNGGNTYGGSSSEKNPVDPIDPGPLVAFCDVPSTAPHSIMNLGFVRPEVVEIQATSAAQCQVVADRRCLTQTVAEELRAATAIDPRHDGWNTVTFEGQRWLQNSWSAQLDAGGAQQHTLQRSYPPSPPVLSGTVEQVLEGGI